MGIDVVHSNLLQVDGKLRSARTTTPEQLDAIVATSGQLIRISLENMYQLQLRINQDTELDTPVQHGSFWLLHLANSINTVITPEGLERNSISQANRGVFSDPNEIVDRFRPYADALTSHDLIPEVRRNDTKVSGRTGAFLLARITPLL